MYVNRKKAVMFVLIVLVLSSFVLAEEASASLPSLDDLSKETTTVEASSGGISGELVLFTNDGYAINEQGEFFKNNNGVDNNEQERLTSLAKGNANVGKAVAEAQQRAKSNRLQAEATKRDQEQQSQDIAEEKIIAEIAKKEGIKLTRTLTDNRVATISETTDGLTRAEIKQATRCFHTPTCESFKLSDNDAATLFDGLALAYEDEANSFIHTQQDFTNSFNQRVEGWQATVGGKTYIYNNNNNNIWINIKDAKDTKTDDQIKSEAQSIQSPEYADAKKRADAAREEADTYSWKTRWWQGLGPEGYAILQGKQAVGEIVGGILGFAGKLSQYRSLSNTLFPDTQWFGIAESEFVERLAALESPVASGYGALFCGIDDDKRAESPGQSTFFFRTRSGTYQFGGALQVEKSPRQSFILCERNPDEEADEEFICPEEFICKNDEFCYKNEDDEEPVKGRFYKIHWRVTAPQDEKFTPFVDENGVAVAFNIYLMGAGEPLPVYKRGDYIKGDDVIQLNNGDTDGAIITKYRPEDFSQACIIFSKGVKDALGEVINEFCADIKEIEKGEIEYAGSERLPSVTSASPGVTLNI